MERIGKKEGKGGTLRLEKDGVMFTVIVKENQQDKEGENEEGEEREDM
jgi:predicted transcriptional regulator